LNAAAQPAVYDIAVIGAGPAGLSAAGRAAAQDREAKTGPRHILLEGFAAHAKTIQRYQKGKHVMAEPGFLDLRSDMRFDAGTRERILEEWGKGLAETGVNVRMNAEVTAISGGKGNFELKLADGTKLAAKHVILAIGTEGNPRKLGAPGDSLERVQYQLDDPKAFNGEVILVVGAGDSAIENAIALSHANEVRMVVRGKEFSRAKEGNLNLVIAAVSDPKRKFSCNYESKIKSVKEIADGGRPLEVVLETPTGTETIRADRVIARLGSIPPRAFLESCGIQFPNARPDAIPALSRIYESNVPGIHIIGSLAGFPLIKQAMNQGYDVVEFIRGNKLKPADYPLLQYQFLGLPYELEAEDLLERFKTVIPMFRELNALAFRELIVESQIIAVYARGGVRDEKQRQMEELARKLAGAANQPRRTRIVSEGEPIYSPGEFGTSFFTILDGEVTLKPVNPELPETKLSRGRFFGEMSLLSGRPRGETAIAGVNCVLVETPRRTMLKLMSSNEEVRIGIDWIFTVRELQRQFAPKAGIDDLRELARRMPLKKLKAGETLFKEGDAGDTLYLLRSGNLTLTRKSDSGPVVVAQLRSGELAGELAVMSDGQRHETAVATVATELIEIGRAEFGELMKRRDSRIEPLQNGAAERLVDIARMQSAPHTGSLVNFMMSEGLGEATNVLVIKDSLCVGCDNCEKACAETHDGVSRLNRKAGATFADIHVPVACRHCEQPHCMKDCPPNAIRRLPGGEVFIDDTCIGCGNCQTNCPYGVIQMAYREEHHFSLLSWLLFGKGPGPGEPVHHDHKGGGSAVKKAAKCDACANVKSGPACVSACPTGAAIRLTPREYVDLVEEQKL
jgi:Fe-S-cluster-containing hydrogenase component 2/thioredoxin reductase/CRP-like cAMP-binding protein